MTDKILMKCKIAIERGEKWYLPLFIRKVYIMRSIIKR